MAKLIKVTKGVPRLSEEISAQIAEFELAKKQIDEKEAELKKQLLAEMEKAGILKVDNDELTITYIAPCDAETFDKKAFKKDHPDLHDQYVTMKPRASYIKIAVKG